MSQLKAKKKLKPKMTFSLDGSKIKLIHSNISTIELNFYAIDLEILFFRDPTISALSSKNESNGDNLLKVDFSFVQPTLSAVLDIEKEKVDSDNNLTVYEIPEELLNKNLYIEAKSNALKQSHIYLASNLQVVICEELGEIQVLNKNLQPVVKCYVKVFCDSGSGRPTFYKDGFTNLVGKFNYLALNTDQLSRAQKFYLFISEEKEGCVVKECNPPKNIDLKSDDAIGNIVRYKQEMVRRLK